MIINLRFSFLYHNPEICSNVIHIMTHLQVVNDLWHLNIFKLYFEFLKLSSTTIFKLGVLFICGWYVIIISIFFPQFVFIKRVFNLCFINWFLGVQKIFIKTKIRFIKLNNLFFNSSSLLSIIYHKFPWSTWH